MGSVDMQALWDQGQYGSVIVQHAGQVNVVSEQNQRAYESSG